MNTSTNTPAPVVSPSIAERDIICADWKRTTEARFRVVNARKRAVECADKAVECAAIEPTEENIALANECKAIATRLCTLSEATAFAEYDAEKAAGENSPRLARLALWRALRCEVSARRVA